MTLDKANQELNKLSSIPEENKTDSDRAKIFEIEQIIDHLTGAEY